MIKDLFGTMQRVHDIQKRFGLKRHNNDPKGELVINGQEQKKSTHNKSYSVVQNEAISRIRDKDMSSLSIGTDKGVPRPVNDQQIEYSAKSSVKLSNLQQLREQYKNSINAVIDLNAAKRNVPAAIIKSIVEIESGYNPLHISPQGGKGLMSLTPEMIRNYSVNNPFSIDENIEAGTALVQRYLQQHDRDYEKALFDYSSDKKNNEPEQFVKDVLKRAGKL